MTISIKEPNSPPQACIIWMHGLGADGTDMAGIAEELLVSNLAIRHIFLDAPIRPVTLNSGFPMRAWYDIAGLELNTREDQKGINESAANIYQVIQKQLHENLLPNQLFLAGFSQGGAMALFTALQYPLELGGIISLSAYLPLADQSLSLLPKETPLFIGGGEYDPIVRPDWTYKTKQWLMDKGYTQINFQTYPIEHSICREEIIDLSNWLTTQINHKRCYE